ATVVTTNITARINISVSFVTQHHFALQYKGVPNTYNKLESLFCAAKDVVGRIDGPFFVRLACRFANCGLEKSGESPPAQRRALGVSSNAARRSICAVAHGDRKRGGRADARWDDARGDAPGSAHRRH